MNEHNTVHHFYWSIPFRFICVFHSDVAMLAQAIFVAVHIHGVNCFGVEPLFYDPHQLALKHHQERTSETKLETN